MLPREFDFEIPKLSNMHNFHAKLNENGIYNITFYYKDSSIIHYHSCSIKNATGCVNDGYWVVKKPLNINRRIVN